MQVQMAEKSRSDDAVMKEQLAHARDKQQKIDDDAYKANQHLETLRENAKTAAKKIKELEDSINATTANLNARSGERQKQEATNIANKGYSDLAKVQSELKTLNGKDKLSSEETARKAQLEQEQMLIQSRLPAESPSRTFIDRRNSGSVDMVEAELKRRQGAVDQGERNVQSHPGNAGYERALEEAKRALQEYKERTGQSQANYHQSTVAVFQRIIDRQDAFANQLNQLATRLNTNRPFFS
jgi:hypothetical protein